MKKMIVSVFCVLITLVTYSQLPQYVISNEWETDDQAKTEKLMNDWKNLILEMDENRSRMKNGKKIGTRIFVLRPEKNSEK